MSGFIQAYRLIERIIEHRGDNSFLSGSINRIRTGVSIDFYPIDKGLTRKYGKVFPAPIMNHHLPPLLIPVDISGYYPLGVIKIFLSL